MPLCLTCVLAVHVGAELATAAIAFVRCKTAASTLFFLFINLCMKCRQVQRQCCARKVQGFGARHRGRRDGGPRASGRTEARRSASHARPAANPCSRARCRPVPPSAAAQDPLPPPPPPPPDSGTQPAAGIPGGDTAHQATKSDTNPSPPTSEGARLVLRACTQVVTLAVALAALILWPAQLSGRLAAEPWRAAASYLLYLVFFASGTLSRMVRHGRLAPERADAQRSSGGARAALLLFAGLAVPAGHFAAFFDPTLLRLAAMVPPPGGPGPQGEVQAQAAAAVVAAAVGQALPWLGYALMLASWALKTAASAALGKVRPTPWPLTCLP